MLIRKHHEIEKIVRKKIELERLLEEKQKINNEAKKM